MNKQKFVSNLFWPILVVKSSRFSLIVQVKYKFETERRLARRLLVGQKLLDFRPDVMHHVVTF